MADEVSCAGCGARLPVPAREQSPWLECPHCRTRVVNAKALRLDGRVPLTWAGVFGTVLILLGTLGWPLGCGAIFLVKQGDSQGEVYVHTLSCVFLIASGLMVLRAGSDKVSRPFLLAASAFALLAVVALLVASGLIFLFATCLTGR